jgi:hypothetical protein
MWSRSSFAIGVAAAVGASIFACTGEDPDLSAPKDDAGTGSETSADQGVPPDDAGGGADAAKTCSRDDPFGPANILGGVNDGAGLFHPRLTPDELEIFYQHGVNAIYFATRSARTLPFSAGSPVPVTDSGVPLYDPAITPDTLVLYVSVNNRIARMTRASRVAAFGAPVLLDLAGDAGVQDQDPHILGNESALYFSRRDVNDGGIGEIWRAQGYGDGGFAPPEHVALGDGAQSNPWVSEDELEIWFAHAPENAILRSVRTSDASAFPAPISVDDINTQSSLNGNPRPGWISPDNCRIYFAAGSSQSQIWFAERTPK